MKKWRCLVCGFVHQGWKPPSHCPICGAAPNMFEEMEDGNAVEEKASGAKKQRPKRDPDA